MPRTAAILDTAPDLPSTHYVDNRIYRDPDIFKVENENLISKVWKFVCHVSEIPEPFDFRTITVAGVPLIVLRDKQGDLKALVNICSHRGARLEERPAGNAKSFQCLFHLWTYDTTGNCIGMPRGEAYEPCNLKKEDLGLREVRIGEKNGLVFVNLDDDAISLDEFLGDSMDPLSPIFDNQELEVIHYHEQVLDTNWKTWQETNMEMYHEYMHVLNRETSLEEEGYFARKWIVHENGHSVLEPLIVNYANFDGMQDRGSLTFKGLRPSEFWISNYFPDLLILCRSSVVRLDTQIPISADKTLIQFRALGVKGESEADRRRRISDQNEFWGPFGRNLSEDMVLCQSQTKAMTEKSGGYSIWAREEGGTTQDDCGIRAYYEAWSHYTGLDPANPDI